MLVEKKVFDAVKGFDESNMSDIDFCLRVIYDTGKSVIYTPYTTLIHHESVTTSFQISPYEKARRLKDVENFKNRWRKILKKGDPYYNPNLSLEESYRMRITPNMIKYALWGR